MQVYAHRKDKRPVKRYRILPIALAAAMWPVQLPGCLGAGEAYAMSAPGGGGANWFYSDKDHHWYYYDEGQEPHTGWLKYEGEWYWFDPSGRMADGGSLVIDGLTYHFYVNGHMVWNQYIGLKYYDGDGQQDGEHDIRVIGTESPTSEDRDLITDYLYEVPRSWIDQFVKDGWQLMFYKKKKYFAAPRTDMGIYYVYHSVDTHYKKAKFAEADAVLQAFGEYVGYAAGCYEEGDLRMQALWNDYKTLHGLLEIPDYYSSDDQFYFGKVFAAYLNGDTREEMQRSAPGACEVLEEILHMKDDEETRTRLREERQAQQKAAEERWARMAEEQGYGPGFESPQKSGAAEESGAAAGAEEGAAE